MIFSRATSKTLDGVGAAFDRLVDEINRFHPTISRLPTFADDASAADGRLKVGDGYVTPDGFVKRRVA